MLFAPQNPKYVINAAVWVYFHKNNQHILLLGSMQGDIILWNWDDDSQVGYSLNSLSILTNPIQSFNLLYRVLPMNDI